MTPLESIKEGILTGNMELVCSGYNRITNDGIEIPSRRRPPEPLGRRENYRDQDEDDFARHPQDDFDTGRGDGYRPKDGDVACRPEPFVPRKRVNMWADEGDRPYDYTEADKRADAEARMKRQTPRRDPYVPLAINCSGCGKRFNVNPVLVIGGVYTCDRCSNKRR